MDQISPFPSTRILGLAPAPSPPPALLSPWLPTKGPRLSCLQHSSLYCSESTALHPLPLQGPWVEEGEESEVVLPLCSKIPH